jgi:hypothetical protein
MSKRDKSEDKGKKSVEDGNKKSGTKKMGRKC